MLKQYLKQQEDNLQLMLRRKQQLQQQAEQEGQRLLSLSQHIAMMEGTEKMACSLSLQNLAGLKHILHSMQSTQQQRADSALQEATLQQQVCMRQASLNLGITDIMHQQMQQAKLKQHRSEQRQDDELSQQLAQRSDLNRKIF